MYIFFSQNNLEGIFNRWLGVVRHVLLPLQMIPRDFTVPCALRLPTCFANTKPEASREGLTRLTSLFAYYTYHLFLGSR